MTGGYKARDNHRLNEEGTVGGRKSPLAKRAERLSVRFAVPRSDVCSEVSIAARHRVGGRAFIIQTM